MDFATVRRSEVNAMRIDVVAMFNSIRAVLSLLLKQINQLHAAKIDSYLF